MVWETDEDKSKAIEKLDTSKYHAQPLRRVYIEKYGKKEKRPLGIPTMQDRAMQGLMLLALEPVAETTADRVSFAFGEIGVRKTPWNTFLSYWQGKHHRSGFWKEI